MYIYIEEYRWRSEVHLASLLGHRERIPCLSGGHAEGEIFRIGPPHFAPWGPWGPCGFSKPGVLGS